MLSTVHMNVPKRVLKGKLYVTRRIGRPRIRWMEDVIADLRRMGISGWMLFIIIGIQPLGRSGQRPEFSQATGVALVRCILGRFLGVACHCFPPLF